MDHECRFLHQCREVRRYFKTFYEPAVWLLTGRAGLDAVGCEVEVITGDISRFKRQYMCISSSLRPASGTEAEGL